MHKLIFIFPINCIDFQYNQETGMQCNVLTKFIEINPFPKAFTVNSPPIYMVVKVIYI